MLINKVDDLLARHAAFWHCRAVERPLVGVTRWSQFNLSQFDWGLPDEEGILRPEMLDVDHFLPQYEALFGDGGPFDDDLCWSAMPPKAIPWLEGALGCPIEYSLRAGSISARPILGDGPLELVPAPLADNSWFAKLLEFVHGLARLADGRFAVGLPLTRGPWDLVAALCGSSSLYLGLYDRPDELARLAGVCADFWIEANNHLSSAIPKWQGGNVAFLGIWAPTFDPMSQDDASASISQEFYRRIMGAADQRTARAWDSAIFHVHSAGLQITNEVLEWLDGRALNITLDPSGPPLDAILPILRGVQERRIPLHVLTADPAQARLLVEVLSPSGLAIMYQAIDPTAERDANSGFRVPRSLPAQARSTTIRAEP